MSRPIRVQRKRTKGWQMPPNTVVVSRPSKWGNPYKVGQTSIQTSGKSIYVHSPDLAVVLYVSDLKQRIGSLENIKDYLKELKGKNLACYCPLNQRCHGDFLLEVANG